MRRVIDNLLSKIESLDDLTDRSDYAQGRRDAFMETLEEIVKTYKEKGNDLRSQS